MDHGEKEALVKDLRRQIEDMTNKLENLEACEEEIENSEPYYAVKREKPVFSEVTVRPEKFLSKGLD